MIFSKADFKNEVGFFMRIFVFFPNGKRLNPRGFLFFQSGKRAYLLDFLAHTRF